MIVNDQEILQQLVKIVDDHEINLNENDILNFLKIKYRWPSKYSWGQSTIQIISQFGTNDSTEFFDLNGCFIYEKWIEFYNLGFTTTIGNVLDLNHQLRELQEKIFVYTGTRINGNFYFCSGSTKHRVSFPSHKHDYHVIVKPIYGKSKWKISGKDVELSEKTLLVPSEQEHYVYECVNKKLSLTLNIM